MKIMIDVTDCDIRDGRFHPSDSGYVTMTCDGCKHWEPDELDLDAGTCVELRELGYVGTAADHFCAKWEAKH